MQQADNFRDLIVSYATDPRIILIKLADRLEVMRSLAMFPKEKQLKKSWESMNLYAQIAHKLGLYSIKSELEDIALSYLEPQDYAYISRRLAESASSRDRFIADFTAPIEEKLKAQGIKYHIKGRTKSIYSIWRKMKRTGVSFDEVYDIFAIRIIADCPPENEKQLCWNIYSIVTDFYTPNPERMRDWISIPKSNGYEIAPHDRGDQGGTLGRDSDPHRTQGRGGRTGHRRPLALQGGSRRGQPQRGVARPAARHHGGDHQQDPDRQPDRHERLAGRNLRLHPDGRPAQTAPGSHRTGFCLRHPLRGGRHLHGRAHRRPQRAAQGEAPQRRHRHGADRQGPEAETRLAGYVSTPKARNKIRSLLREEEAKAAHLGREELERKLRNWRLNVPIDDAVAVLIRYYKLHTGTELYAAIAKGEIDIADTKELIARHLSGELFEPKTRPASTAAKSHAERSEDALVIDETIRGIDYKLAKCCNPIFGDDIFAFTTVSSGITIHRSDCPNALRLKEMYPYRVLEARWRDDSRPGTFLASIRLVAEDVTGIVNRITETITGELEDHIRSMNLSPMREGRIGGVINIEVTNTSIIDMVAANLMKIKGVEKAYRITGQV